MDATTTFESSKMSGSYPPVNDVLQLHGMSSSKLTVRTLTYEDDDSTAPSARRTFVLLEGNENALRFLAETILAHIATPICDLSLHPSGAGSAHFDPTSTAGIILHTLPCENGHY